VTDAVDTELLVQLRVGSARAFTRVYEAEKGTIFGLLLRLSRNREVAHDLFQNTWLKLARHAHTLREDTDLRAWLLTVARNEYRSFRRAQLVDTSRLLAWRSERRLDDGSGSAFEDGALDAALARLSEADREVLLLVATRDVSSSQAAQVLGINAATLRQRLARARKRLATELAKSELLPRLASKEK
jgi:RNA polymerase sigma factor (sigma-70 family)